jgi:hypothetical protein
MSDQDPVDASSDLQFDRVVSASNTQDTPDRSGVHCESCHSAIATEYFQVNGHVCCGRCRTAIEAAAEPPQGVWPFAVAASIGFAAALAGAAIYWAVLALAHLEIGLVAILIGYMVGTAVRRGAGMRGGLRFQILAVLLTYGAVALAYTPVVVKRVIEARETKNAAAGNPARTARTATVVQDGSSAPSLRPLVALMMLLGFVAALPVIVVVSSMPSGLISGLIIAFGLRQAWKMTGQPHIEVLGPYRVGDLAAQA